MIKPVDEANTGTFVRISLRQFDMDLPHSALIRGYMFYTETLGKCAERLIERKSKMDVDKEADKTRKT